MTDRPNLTIKQAANAAGVSQRTMRRRVSEGAFPGAHKAGTDPLSPWLIPTEDLIAAGFSLHRSTAPAAERVEVVADPGAVRSVVANLEVEQLRAELVEERHRRELAELRSRAEVAEGRLLAAERIAEVQLQRAEVAERALLAITGGAAPGPATPKRRRWWQGGGSPSQADTPTG